MREVCGLLVGAVIGAVSIFVFGSNERGAHGKGAALFAKRYRGAVYGQAEGLQGDSYAIPTKDAGLRPLPLTAIEIYVERFLSFAAAHPTLIFTVTPIGCGLAGYAASDIAPMFQDAPANCQLPASFLAAISAANAR